MAIFPWLRSWERQDVQLSDYPNAKRWFAQIAARPAVVNAIHLLSDVHRAEMDAKARELLFGAAQYQRR